MFRLDLFLKLLENSAIPSGAVISGRVNELITFSSIKKTISFLFLDNSGNKSCRASPP